jgi:hypothetical protein
MAREDPVEVLCWKGSSLARAACGDRSSSVGQDHLTHGVDAVVLEEHVLGAAQADALGTELAARFASPGVSALVRTLRLAVLVGPFHHFGVARERRLRVDGTGDDFARGAIEDHVALCLKVLPPTSSYELSPVDHELHRHRPHRACPTASHHGSVTGHTAACWSGYPGPLCIPSTSSGLVSRRTKQHVFASSGLFNRLVGR